MGWEGMRAQLHEIARAAPGVLASPKEVMDLIALANPEPQLREVEVRPARLNVARVEIHQHEDQVVFMLFREADQLVVADPVELQAPVGLQCRICFSYLRVSACIRG